jgi:cysteine protease ATG4
LRFELIFIISKIKGWVNYIKKPSKLDTDSELPIFILGKEFYSCDPESAAYAAEESSQPRKHRNNFAAKSVNSSYHDYYDTLGAQPNLSASITNNYSIVPKPAVHFSSNANDGGFLSLTYSNVSTSPPAAISVLTTTTTPSTSNMPLIQQHQQQPNALLNSFSSMESSNTTATTVSPPVRTRPQFLNRFLSENLINTPLEQEIYSRLWFTYRKDFVPLRGNPKYTSDCGWGCMLRSGQMMMAQALVQHHFTRSWSLLRSLKNKSDLDLYRDIVSLFNDRPKLAECPFGLHNLLEIADESATHTSDTASNVVASTGRSSRVGTWFGPTAVCLLLRDALNGCIKSNASHPLLQNLRVYVAQDCTIFRQDVLKLCVSGENASQTFIPCIILISVRLGGESINKIYYEPLKEFFKMSTCIGMVGGKPKHSLYFIGYQGDKVIYLDPHLCQPAVNVFSTKSDSKKKTSSLPRQQHQSQYKTQPSNPSASDYRKPGYKTQFETYDLSSSSTSSISSINSNDSELFDNSSFHCASPSKTAFSKLDPSLAIGFYCKSLKEFDDLCDTVRKVRKTYEITGDNLKLSQTLKQKLSHCVKSKCMFSVTIL